ncbi:MAG: DUF488 domain-containing protein [Defluviicoccus sp.]|nr:DUF488 domain-containing protein [Defluviicoccus sp.]MDG4591529.1 DUF488 domain-containing protein [Defluviicoccus sp.]
MVAVCVYTIGHSTRSTAQLIELLQAEMIVLVVDVRRFPRSRRHPQFDIERLPATLAAGGIAYRHIEALGGRRRRSLTADASPNTSWREEGFRNYADYAMTAPFQKALNDLVAEAQNRKTAIMCAEALWWQCHRRIISDYLLVRGIDVIHILGPGELQPAQLTAGAELQPDGRLHYPPAQPRLL